jgi:hypothetical protein
MAFARKSYSGPVKNRGTVNGKADVSREELNDFRAKFGKDKTLRDLLNADKGPAPKAQAPKPTPKAEAPRPAAKTEAPKSMTPAEKGKNLASKFRLPDSVIKTKAYNEKGAPNIRTAPPKKEQEKPSPVKVGSGKTAIERMNNTVKNKFGMNKGGKVK